MPCSKGWHSETSSFVCVMPSRSLNRANHRLVMATCLARSSPLHFAPGAQLSLPLNPHDPTPCNSLTAAACGQQQAFDTPPVTEQFQVVGHNGDSASHPSFFMFINMRGTVQII